MEFGCESGRLLNKKFVEAGVEAWGMDLSMNLTTRGRKRLMLIPDSPFRLVEDDMTDFIVAVYCAATRRKVVPILGKGRRGGFRCCGPQVDPAKPNSEVTLL